MHTEKMMNYVKTAGADALLLLDEADMHYVCGFFPQRGHDLGDTDGCVPAGGLSLYGDRPGSTRRTPACR